MNSQDLYLRVATVRNGRTMCHDYVLNGEVNKTDEDAERSKQKIINDLKQSLPPNEKIIGAEFVPPQTFTPLIRDNDKVMPWRTVDLIALSLSYGFEDETGQVAHPKFMPTAVIRILVDENPATMGTNKRELIRVMAANYLLATTKKVVYTLNFIDPDTYWSILGTIGRTAKSSMVSSNMSIEVVTYNELKRVSDEYRKRVEEEAKKREEAAKAASPEQNCPPVL